MSKIKLLFNKIFMPLFMVLFTVVLTINAVYFISDGDTVVNQDQFDDNHYSNIVKKGNVSSLITLGEMYEKGQFVQKDLAKSQEFFKKAIDYIKTEMSSHTIKSEEINEYEEKEISESDHKTVALSDNENLIENTNTDVNLDELDTTVIAKVTTQAPVSSVKKIAKPVKKIVKNTQGKSKSKKVSKKKSSQQIALVEKELITEYETHQVEEDIAYNDEDLVFEDLEMVVIEEPFDEEIIYGVKKDVTKKTPEKKVLSKNSFTSNPCDTAAAQYIARCIRNKRTHNH